MKIAITAAGGGHTGYAVALAQRLRRRNVSLLFIVAEGDKWSKTLVERYGDVVETPRLRSPGEGIAKLVARTPKAILKTLKLGLDDVDVLVSTGANPSLLPAVYARLRGVKVYSLEAADRIATASRTTRILYHVAHITALQWPEQTRNYPRGRVYGPVYEEPMYSPSDEGYVLVIGGTMGYHRLFKAVSRLGLEKVVIQTGRLDPARYWRPGWKVFRFDPDLQKWIAGASIVIAHPGKTTLDARLAYGKPLIIVYNPELKLSSTRMDAEMLARKLNAVFLDEPDPSRLKKAIREAPELKPPRYADGALMLCRDIVG